MASPNGIRPKRQVSPASGSDSAPSVRHSCHRLSNDPLQGLDDNDRELSQTQKQMYRVLLQHQESLNVKQREIFVKLQRKVSKTSTLSTTENGVNGVLQYSGDGKNEPKGKQHQAAASFLETATVTAETQDSTDQLKIELAASHTGLHPHGGPFPRQKGRKTRVNLDLVQGHKLKGAKSEGQKPEGQWLSKRDTKSSDKVADPSSSDTKISTKNQGSTSSVSPLASVPYHHKHHLHRRRHHNVTENDVTIQQHPNDDDKRRKVNASFSTSQFSGRDTTASPTSPTPDAPSTTSNYASTSTSPLSPPSPSSPSPLSSASSSPTYSSLTSSPSPSESSNLNQQRPHLISAGNQIVDWTNSGPTSLMTPASPISPTTTFRNLSNHPLDCLQTNNPDKNKHSLEKNEKMTHSVAQATVATSCTLNKTDEHLFDTNNDSHGHHNDHIPITTRPTSNANFVQKQSNLFSLKTETTCSTLSSSVPSNSSFTHEQKDNNTLIKLDQDRSYKIEKQETFPSVVPEVGTNAPHNDNIKEERYHPHSTITHPPLPKLRLTIKKLNTSPIHKVDVNASARETIEGALAASKNENFFDLPKLCLTIDGVPPPREYPVPPESLVSRDKLNPPTPSVTITSKKEALSSALYNVCISQPVTVLRGYASALKLDLGLFSTRTLVEVNSDHPVEVRTQRQQKSEENWDSLGQVKVWLCESSRSHTSVARYAQYQANSFQESLVSEDPPIALTGTKAAGLLIPSAKSTTASKETQSSSIKSDPSKGLNSSSSVPPPVVPGMDFKMIKFGTNVDLSDDKKWKPQLKELQKLPSFFRVISPSNMLSHVGHTILGMNSVQLYMKVPGARTPGHQENNNFCSVNLNIGPGDCEWFAVDEPFWGLVHDLCEKHGVNYLVGSWWPILEELFEMGIPVFRFLQSPGDIVWLSPGTIHWVQAVGWCNNIAWNVGPLTVYQYRVAMERYEFNKYYQVKSIVPMLQLSWNLAKNLKISDRDLWDALRSVLQRSLRHVILTLELVKKIKGVTSTAEAIKWQGCEVGEAAHYCNSCEAEVFNILFAKEDPQLKKYVVYCFDCARKISTVLEKFVVLNQFTVEQLSSIYDNFILTNPAAVGTNVGSGLVVVSSGSMTSGLCISSMTMPTATSNVSSSLPDTPSPTSSSSSSSIVGHMDFSLLKPCSIKLEPAKPCGKYDHVRKMGHSKLDLDI